MTTSRRHFLRLSAVAGGTFTTVRTTGLSFASTRPLQLEEATLPELRSRLLAGRLTAVSLTREYLERIEALDRRGPALNSVIEANPDALAIAAELDKEFKAHGARGPLHGIPVLIKDNIDTHDRMMTTAGSLALLGSIPPCDAGLVAKLRAAGAVILGKTNLSEWANFRGERSTSGWSGRGGLTRNPYVLDRNPSGSSSGSAVAVSANLCSVAVGTETDGSIISPSTVCGVVGIKPTVGLVSRSGIIPISHSQDTAGPIARRVGDAAILLGVLAGPDSRDPATSQALGYFHQDYTPFLDRHGLKGARLGVVKRYFRPGLTEKPLQSVLDALKQAGAVLVDVDHDFTRYGDAEFQVMLYEFKAGLNNYFASLGPDAPVRTLQDVIDFNVRNTDRELRYFGQQTLVRAQEKGPLTDKAYIEALARCRRITRDEGIDAVMEKDELDALIAPSGGPAVKTDLVYGDRSVGGSSSPAAVAGYPSITVPAGDVMGLPFGLSFFGRAFSEPALLRIAFAFESITGCRTAPRFLDGLK